MPLRHLFAAFACAAASVLSCARAQSPTLPPTPSVRLAVNPVTNKVYAPNKDANTVTVLDSTTGTRASIAVGGSPDFVAVDPTRNRIYVNNTRDASLTVIDGATDAVIATHNIGSLGPIAMNPDPASLRNVVYIVRMTSAASDEVTYFYQDTPTWYSIATDSFQPGALAVNPATHTIFVAHYATGDLRIIDGTFNGNDFPHPPTLGMWSKPFAVAANPVTNKVYVTTEDSRGPIGIVDPATMNARFPAVTAGHAVGPRAVVVNPVTNRIYAAFAGEVIVIDGATDALTYIPITNAGSGAISLGIDYATNRIYAATEFGTLSVIDGATSTVESTAPIAAGTSSIGVNPVTNTVYLYANGAITALAGAAGSPQGIPLTTTITPFAGGASGPSGTLTLSASSAFAPTALPVRKVYFRLDSTTGRWTEAAASGSNFTASFSGLAAGSHTLHAYAVDDQVAQLSTGPQSNPLVGQIASYTFTVSGTTVTPSVSIASSANPSTTGQSVTFTASVTGTSGTPTGTVTFLDGATTLCAATALASGSAGCTTGTLSTGAHSITARYSGDATYAAATSSAINQAVNAPKTTPTVAIASSANPSVAGNAVTFSATLTGSAGTPTGSVSFLDGGTAIAGCAAVTLATGRASCTTSALGAGTHSITAQYGGDAGYLAGTSGVLSQAVNAPPPPPPPAPSLSNISTRALTGTGDATLIGGFVIGGSGSKTVVVTVAGPSLSRYGVSNPLANPAIKLVRQSDGAVIGTNDNWGDAANAAQIQAAGFAPADRLEPAIMMSLPSGAYTALVSGADGSNGIGVVAVYEVDHPEVPLVNISTRGQVLGGENVMIGGFVIQGSSPQTVVIAGTGPSLASYGVANALSNPVLTLVRQSDGAVLATNDDWGNAPNAADIRAAGFAPADARESAMMVTLPPGAYTAVMSGSGGATGVGVIALYRP